MTTTVEIDGTVEWTVAKDEESGLWVGVCPALNLNTDGETFPKLCEGMNEAIGMLFSVLHEDGELAPFLHERGWRIVGPPPAATSEPQFSLPYEQHIKDPSALVSA